MFLGPKTGILNHINKVFAGLYNNVEIMKMWPQICRRRKETQEELFLRDYTLQKWLIFSSKSDQT